MVVTVNPAFSRQLAEYLAERGAATPPGSMLTDRVNVTLLLKCLRVIERERVNWQLLAVRFGVSPRTLRNLGATAREKMGVRIDWSPKMKMLFVSDYGVLSRERVLHGEAD